MHNISILFCRQLGSDYRSLPCRLRPLRPPGDLQANRTNLILNLIAHIDIRVNTSIDSNTTPQVSLLKPQTFLPADLLYDRGEKADLVRWGV